MNEKVILKNKEVALMLGITENSLRQMRHNRQIPYYKSRGRRVYYLKSEIEEWALALRVATKQEIEERAFSGK